MLSFSLVSATKGAQTKELIGTLRIMAVKLAEIAHMAVNKPTDDNARKGAVKKRSQTKATIGGQASGPSATNSLESSWP